MFLIAHRANDNHGFSENSKNAIISCLDKEYIDGIEIDVRITKDKRLVLQHDSIIDFNSNGHGIIKYMTLSQLKKYKYGKSSEEITTLEEVLMNFNNKLLLIELKEIGNDYVPLVDELVRIINIYENINIYVCSFNFNLLTYLKNNYSNIKCGLIIGFGLNKLKAINNLDFLVLSSNNLEFINQKQDIFVFGINSNKLSSLKEKAYFITDESFRLQKYKNDVKIMPIN